MVEPREGTRTVADRKRYRDAGVSRIAVYAQKTRHVVKRSAPLVERAQ
jgi:hypothetical protein